MTLILASLPGCAAPKPWERVQLDEIPRDRITEIDALPEVNADELPTKRYADLGPVEGISCKRGSKESASWEDAIRRTKFRVLQKGGNAIANLDCEAPRGMSLTTMCYESIRCTASAVRSQ